MLSLPFIRRATISSRFHDTTAQTRPSIFVMEHAVGLLNSLQFRVRLKAQPLPKRFGHDNPPRFIDSDFHAVHDTIYHRKWQSHVALRIWRINEPLAQSEGA